MLILDPISAIPSWESYEYQGHISLYVILKDIYTALHCGEDISTSELQIEGKEDFSIRKDGKYLSIHQVKAGTVKLSEEDKFSFVIEMLQSNADYGYFHIATEEKIPSDFVVSTLSHIDNLKRELGKKIINRRDLKSTDKEENYIVVENISKNHKKASIYNIIKYVSENSKDINEIKKVVKEIKTAIDKFEKKINQTVSKYKSLNPLVKDDEVFLSVYGERFDNVKQIRSKAYQIILDIIGLKRPQYTIFTDEAYAALVYNQLLILMKSRITDIYIQKNKHENCTLSYREILELILIDYHETIDTIAYQYFQILRAIWDAYAEYPNQMWNGCNAINCHDCNKANDCNLYNQISILNAKTEEEKSEIIHNLILRTPQIGKSNNLPTDDLIAHLFLFLLDEINIMYLDKNGIYQATKDGSKTFRLSLDTSYDIWDFQKN